jgi:hypothetical protein
MPKRRIQRVVCTPSSKHTRRVRLAGAVLELERRPNLELRVESGERADVASPGVRVQDFEGLWAMNVKLME